MEVLLAQVFGGKIMSYFDTVGLHLFSEKKCSLPLEMVKEIKIKHL
jgi:hypothetical protein